ncbi:MAG TPA: cell division protein FtsQ [Nocardioides bacterium]|uniref:cell division protein FtsQ/DivIB n=1 Tax=uncultured Nocardioides sp. TaxID=198441 RepID=UPI000ED0B62F|nr:FtsQ-type POTRA domain-containing protein [uncultured Nocardioides sp.]HCB05184.1 cell division protein FtsQ [Nocardioides sp.]HRD63623.1 FtsQ-type POTRA domain-containing protein [Nocardioides sp.]HRK48036.1 FtsQ-type POTRA domain-containing protein [Nocardioides sp.]
MRNPLRRERRDDGVDKATRRSRKRFSRRQWRRRWLSWRPLLALVLVAALVGVGIYALWFSTWLAVDDVDVSGAETVEVSEVKARSGIDVGEPMISADLDNAERRIGALAVIRSVTVTRQWPNGILISIEERTPIAVVQIGDRLRGMDEEGVVFRDYRTAPPELPRVVTTSGTTSAALREAAEVVSALPQDLALIVDHVQVASVDEISLVLKDGREVVWGSADESATKADVLATLLATVKAQVYDVSVPSRPTTR